MARTHQPGPNRRLPLQELPGAAMRAVLREGYGRSDLKADVLAGLVVGVVALPLAMALSIAVGAPPQNGLYTAVVAGFLAAALGGSRMQVTGPTAAFVVILAPIYAKFGLAGLLVSGLLGGALLAAMGLLRLGRLIEYIPHPVTTGFTAGIALVIAGLQVKDLCGLSLPTNPEHFLERMAVMLDARHSASFREMAVGGGTLLLLILVPRMFRKVPAPLLVLPLAAVAVHLLSVAVPGFSAETLDSRFGGIPRLPPMPMLPWHAPGPGGAPFVLDFAMIRALAHGAFAVAMLGAIESLLSAVVADGMAGTRHHPDAELLAQGVGNLAAPFFGGIPATGAIARTAANIRSGARSPVSAMVHALTILAVVLVLAPWIGFLPMASLAALLLRVAWNMAELRHFGRILKAAPRSDVIVLLTCFSLTVAFDMVIAVSVGMVLAALLLIGRMAEATQGRLAEGHPALPRHMPGQILIYDIDGPLFFGAAQRAMEALGSIGDRARVVILRMEAVPAMDATGLVALESALESLEERGCLAVLTGLQTQPQDLLRKGGVGERLGRLAIRPDMEGAIQAAGDFLGAPRA